MGKSKDVINILSIDGGGIRGLISAEIVVYIENKLQELYGSDTRISDHFDYIAGTSTGGILTCLYTFPDQTGRPKFTAQEASDFYFTYGSKIFKKKLRWYVTLGGLLAPRYSAKYLENLFEKYFEDITIKNATTNFMITSVATDTRDLYLFKSYKAKKDQLHDKMFREAARSTSAAPTHFEPYRMPMEYGTELSLIDGGLGINNPSISAFIEVMKLYPKAKKINTLSIGTGASETSYPYSIAKKWGIISGASKLFNLTLTSMSDAVCYQMEKLYENENILGSFLRVNPCVYYASNKMDDGSVKNLKLLKEAGQKSAEDYKKQIDKFLKNMQI